MLSGSRVTAALERLAERRVSGILEIEGNPAGTIYLNQGQITFARASWIPDLGARLPGALRPSAAAPDLIADPDRPDRDVGSVLVQRKYLSRAELEAILRSVIMDAALVLMAPSDQDAFVSDVRFAAPGGSCRADGGTSPSRPRGRPRAAGPPAARARWRCRPPRPRPWAG